MKTLNWRNVFCLAKLVKNGSKKGNHIFTDINTYHIAPLLV